MMSKLVVYTAITGGYGDQLKTPKIPHSEMLDVDFVCFSDCVTNPPSPWIVKPPAWQHQSSSRRTARYHKLHPHLLFPDADFSIWIDGSEQLAYSPRKLIARYLASTDFATFKHPDRSTVAAEVSACIRLKKDQPTVLTRHLSKYQAEGFRDQSGMYETAMVLRRHTPQIERTNNMWWSELTNGSLRDQVSLPYVLHKTGTKVKHVAGCRGRCPYLVHKPHKR
jgi:hypothetical protein